MFKNGRELFVGNLSVALVVHTPHALRISTAEERYELVMDGPAPPGAALATRVVGIGLAHCRCIKG